MSSVDEENDSVMSDESDDVDFSEMSSSDSHSSTPLANLTRKRVGFDLEQKEYSPDSFEPLSNTVAHSSFEKSKLNQDGSVSLKDFARNPEKFSFNSSHYVHASIQQILENHYELANTRYNLMICKNVASFIEINSVSDESISMYNILHFQSSSNNNVKRKEIHPHSKYAQLSEKFPLFVMTFYIWYQLLIRYSVSLQYPITIMISILQSKMSSSNVSSSSSSSSNDQFKQDVHILKLFEKEWTLYIKLITKNPKIRKVMNANDLRVYLSNVTWSQLADLNKRKDTENATYGPYCPWRILMEDSTSHDTYQNFFLLGLWQDNYSKSSIEFILTQPETSVYHLDQFIWMGDPFDISVFESWKTKVVRKIQQTCVGVIQKQDKLLNIKNRIQLRKTILSHFVAHPSSYETCYQFLFQFDPSFHVISTLPTWVHEIHKDKFIISEKHAYRSMYQSSDPIEYNTVNMENIDTDLSDTQPELMLYLSINRWHPSMNPETYNNQIHSGSLEGVTFNEDNDVQHKEAIVFSKYTHPSMSDFYEWVNYMRSDTRDIFKFKMENRASFELFKKTMQNDFESRIQNAMIIFLELYCRYSFICTARIWDYHCENLSKDIYQYVNRDKVTYKNVFEKLINFLVQSSYSMRDIVGKISITDEQLLIEELNTSMNTCFDILMSLSCYFIWLSVVEFQYPSDISQNFQNQIHLAISGIKISTTYENDYPTALQDTGKGFTIEIQKSLLHPFQEKELRAAEINMSFDSILKWVDQVIRISRGNIEQSGDGWILWNNSTDAKYTFQYDKFIKWLLRNNPFVGDVQFIYETEHTQTQHLLAEWRKSVLQRLPNQSIFTFLVTSTFNHTLNYSMIQNWSLLQYIAYCYVFIECVQVQLDE